MQGSLSMFPVSTSVRFPFLGGVDLQSGWFPSGSLPTPEAPSTGSRLIFALAPLGSEIRACALGA